MFSNTAITVEKAANIINKKNNVPITLPPGIALKILESVVNKKLARYSLSRGVSNGETTGIDAAEIIFNALNMPVCVVKSFGTNPEYKIDNEYLLSEKLFDIYNEIDLSNEIPSAPRINPLSL